MLQMSHAREERENNIGKMAHKNREGLWFVDAFEHDEIHT